MQEVMRIKDTRAFNNELLVSVIRFYDELYLLNNTQWLAHPRHLPFDSELRSNLSRIGAPRADDVLQRGKNLVELCSFLAAYCSISTGKSTNPYVESQRKK